MSYEAKSYEQGFEDGVSAYITVCANHPDCVGCPVSNELAGDMTCETFIKTQKGRAASILMQAVNGDHSYFAEYRLRFPHSSMSIEDMSESACRKAIFNGDTTCTGGNCLECWNEPYFSDIAD